MNASDYAGWWGAVVATVVFAWDLIKWKKSGPRLKTRVYQPAGGWPSEFAVFTTNVGDAPATIEKVQLRLFQRRFPAGKREIDLNGGFGLSGMGGFPPLTLAPGEPWEVNISPCAAIPKIPMGNLDLVVEIVESHRNKPYRYYPDPKRFLEHVSKAA